MWHSFNGHCEYASLSFALRALQRETRVCVGLSLGSTPLAKSTMTSFSKIPLILWWCFHYSAWLFALLCHAQLEENETSTTTVHLKPFPSSLTSYFLPWPFLAFRSKENTPGNQSVIIVSRKETERNLKNTLTRGKRSIHAGRLLLSKRKSVPIILFYYFGGTPKWCLESSVVLPVMLGQPGLLVNARAQGCNLWGILWETMQCWRPPKASPNHSWIPPDLLSTMLRTMWSGNETYAGTTLGMCYNYYTVPRPCICYVPSL